MSNDDKPKPSNPIPSESVATQQPISPPSPQSYELNIDSDTSDFQAELPRPPDCPTPIMNENFRATVALIIHIIKKISQKRNFLYPNSD